MAENDENFFEKKLKLNFFFTQYTNVITNVKQINMYKKKETTTALAVHAWL